ncbi:porin [Lonepinella sp. BR2271]|uniref:porin n=1 Tax=Lonepinella sp. BR2271 TaxID=3434550 RepID=UPI003F6DD330
MKKTLIALAVAALASSAANATVVYQQDGTKIDIDGRVSLQIRNDTGKRSDLVDKGSRLRVRAYQDIANGFQALANYELRFTSKDIGDSIHSKRMFGGISHPDIGTLTFGRQLLTGDAIGVADFTYERSSITKMVDQANKAIHFESAVWGGFHFSADYVFGDAAKERTSYKDDDGNTIKKKGYSADDGRTYQVGAYYNGKFGDFGLDIEAGYSEALNGNYADDEYKTKAGGAGIRVSYDKFALGFDWAGIKADRTGNDINNKNAFTKFRVGNITHEKLNQYEIGLKYQITPQNKVYAEYLFGTGKNPKLTNTEDTKFRGWFLGADHQFNKNVVVYVEGGSFKTKQSGKEIEKNKEIALGARVFF